MRVQPLKRTTLTDSLLTQLRRQILTGRLKPGQQIPPELALCDAFDVGRTTVREALRGLEAAGFVIRAGKRLVVQDPQELEPEQRDFGALAARVSVRDVYEARKLLELQLVRMAAEEHSSSGLEDLKVRLEATERSDQHEYHTADADFHAAIAHLGKSVVLAEIYDASRSLFFHLPTYWKLFGLQTDESDRLAGIDGASGGHRRIVEAIERRDSEAAAWAVFEHLDTVEKRLIALINPGIPGGDDSNASTGNLDSEAPVFKRR